MTTPKNTCYAKNMIKYKKKDSVLPLQSGQIVLIVVLVAIVSLTIGLSLVSRSISSLRTSTEEADSQKALSAAEAGIERALKDSTNTPLNETLDNSSKYETKEVESSGTEFLLNGGNLITQNEGADIWFANHNSDGTINYGSSVSLNHDFFYLYWGSPQEGACNSSDPSLWPAAIEAIVVSRSSSGEIKSYRYAYDLCGDRRDDNNFTQADTRNKTINGKTFKIGTPSGNKKSLLSLPSGGGDVRDVIFIRVIPLYKNTIIGVSACNLGGNNCTPLPRQGSNIVSLGQAGTANSKVAVFEGWPQLYLPYLSYGLFVPKK